MEQINNNIMRRTKRSLYPNNSASNNSKKNKINEETYPQNLNCENKLNIRNVNTYNPNNFIISNMNFKTNQNLINEKIENELSNYYSYTSKNNGPKIRNYDKTEDLMNQYSLKQNLQSKYYLNYLQKKRNTYNYQNENNITPDFQKINTTEINEYEYNNNNDNNNNNNFRYNLRDRIINSGYGKNFIINRLSASKSSNNFFMGEDHDISIEYNNAPIINSKRSNYDNFLNSLSNDNNNDFHSIKSKNNFSYKNSNNHIHIMKTKNRNNSKINYKNYPYNYNDNKTNKNDNNLYNKDYTDINLSNIFMNDDKNYNFLTNAKKERLFESSNININNINKSDIKVNNDDFYNLPLKKFQRNNNLLELYNSNNNYNSNNKKIKVNINNNLNLSINKTKNLKTDSNKNIPNKVNKKANYINRNKSNYNNNSKKSSYNNMHQLKKYTRSKVDLLKNKEDTYIIRYNNLQGQNFDNSPKINKISNPNTYNNIQQLETNYYNNNLNTLKNNYYNEIAINGNKKSNIYEKFEFKYFKENDNKNRNNKNIPFQQKIILIKENGKNWINPYNSVDLENLEKSNKQYNMKFNRCNQKYSIEKKTNISDYYTAQENLNLFEPKNKTSRYDNTKVNEQNVINSLDNLDNEYLNKNNFGYKSTKNVMKKSSSNNMLSGLSTSYKKKITISPTTNNIFQYNLSNNKINNNYNIINIDIDDYNSKNYPLYNSNITPKLIINKYDNKINNINTIPNDNKEFLQSENKKSYNMVDNEEECYSLLKSINTNKQSNNIPVKLYLKKKEIIKDKEEDENNINKIEINNYLKNLNFSNKNNNNNKVRKYNSVVDNNKININNNNFNNLNKKNNNLKKSYNNIENNIININSTPDSNKKKNSININIIDNNFINACDSKNNNIMYKNNRNNLKTVANELFQKNKNFKNINKLKSSISKNNSNGNYFNPETVPSFIKTNTIRFNENNNNNIRNTKSYKNILNKRNNNQSNYNINSHDHKKLFINNSEAYLFSKKITNKENNNFNSTSKINISNSNDNINLNKEILSNNMSFKNINNNERNSNIYVNRGLIKILKSSNQDTSNLNLFNYYKKIDMPLISTNNSIQLNMIGKSKAQSPAGIYKKPFCIISMSKSKKNNKARSEMKINNKSKKTENVTSLKKNKKVSKSLTSELSFNKSPLFYRIDEHLKYFINSHKKMTASSNTHIKNNISSINLKENFSSFEKKKNIKDSLIINNIRESYNKNYCFFCKYYNYSIKQPKIEICYFIKNNKSNNLNKKKFINSLDKSNKDKNLKEEEKSPIIKDVFLPNNDNEEEKINESSQNGFLMTFGEVVSNKKNNLSKNNIDNIVGNIIEDSDYDIIKNLPLDKNNNRNNNNGHFTISENEDIKVFDSSEREKNSNRNLNSEIFKSTNEIDDEYDKKLCKTYKKNSLYNLEKAEKGLKILGKLALRRGIKTTNMKINNNNDEKKEDLSKKNNKIYMGANKLNEIFNSRKDFTCPNNEEKGDNINDIESKKSVDKEMLIDLSKIKNVFEKNSINDEFEINKFNTYQGKFKMNNVINSNDIYDNNKILDDEEILKQKLITYIPKNENNLELSKINEKEKLYNNMRFSVPNRSKKIININEDIIDKKSLEKYEKYLREIKAFQLSNIIKHDIIYLLNILVEKNYLDVFNELTKIILYKNKNNTYSDNNILNKNNDIIENEHIFKNILFKKATTEIKYIVLYAKLCNDLNNNISNELSDQKNMKNNKERNLKLIISEECLSFINNLKTIEKNNITDKENNKYIFLSKKVKGYVIFVFELINLEILKQQFGFYILEQFYKIYNDNISNNLIRDLFLESIIILINKLGKLVLEKNNKKLIQNINNYINSNLNNIINNENINSTIPNYLKYKIINLFIKRDNQWKDHLFEILKEEEKIKNSLLNIEVKENNLNDSKNINKNINNKNKIISNNYINNNNEDSNNTSKNKEINLKDINKAIIEEDLINYISYFTEENNKGEINMKKDIDKSYNWKMIDELINDKNIGLESVINYFISICTNLIFDENKLVIANDYIKNIIEYYSNNLPKKSKDSIQNEMIKTFLNIDEIVNKNNNMYKILGNLLFILIDNKLYQIKYFNNYLKLEKQTQINLAIITRYCIISSGKFAKKYLNDFKQTKLFINNDIFIQNVNEALKDLFYFIK